MPEIFVVAIKMVFYHGQWQGRCWIVGFAWDFSNLGLCTLAYDPQELAVSLRDQKPPRPSQWHWGPNVGPCDQNCSTASQPPLRAYSSCIVSGSCYHFHPVPPDWEATLMNSSVLRREGLAPNAWGACVFTIAPGERTVRLTWMDGVEGSREDAWLGRP